MTSSPTSSAEPRWQLSRLPAATPLSRSSSSCLRNGFGDVVVGAGIQRAQFLALGVGRRQDQDRHFAQPPDVLHRARRQHHPAARGRAPARREGPRPRARARPAPSAPTQRCSRHRATRSSARRDSCGSAFTTSARGAAPVGAGSGAISPIGLPGSNAAAAARSRLPRAPGSPGSVKRARRLGEELSEHRHAACRDRLRTRRRRSRASMTGRAASTRGGPAAPPR